MSPRAFDRYFVVRGASRHVKFRRLTVAERHAFFLGVLSIAAGSEPRGRLLIGAIKATAEDVAHEAEVPVAAARSAIRKLLEVGVLYEDDAFGLVVHDWDDVQPAPKVDRTNAERQARYRASRNAVTNASATGAVTASNAGEVEGEVEVEDPPTPQGAVTVESLDDAKQRLAMRDLKLVFDEWVKVTGRTGQTLFDQKRQRVIREARKRYPLDDCLDAVRGWRHSPHHRGENPTGTIYNDLGLLLRDAAHIEKFRDLQRGAGGRGNDDGFLLGA